MDKQDKKEMKAMGSKKFIKQEKADIREAKKGYPAPKQPKKKGK